MKKAFTMIELIFVIVIIGILAAVAMPKLAASRDDAEASVCTSEIGQLLHEIASEYAKRGNHTFKSTTISDMTNIPILSVGKSTGIKTDSRVDTVGITYVCGNEDIVAIVGGNAGMEYNLTVTVTTGTNPVSQIAAQDIIKNIIGGNTSKAFVL
jgi:prepilin-type N-terminal cleavage/methylation domain-containing protein